MLVVVHLRLPGPSHVQPGASDENGLDARLALGHELAYRLALRGIASVEEDERFGQAGDLQRVDLRPGRNNDAPLVRGDGLGVCHGRVDEALAALGDRGQPLDWLHVLDAGHRAA